MLLLLQTEVGDADGGRPAPFALNPGVVVSNFLPTHRIRDFLFVVQVFEDLFLGFTLDCGRGRRNTEVPLNGHSVVGVPIEVLFVFGK